MRKYEKKIIKILLCACLTAVLCAPVMAHQDSPVGDLRTWAINAAQGKVTYVDLNTAEERFAMDDGWTDSEVRLVFDGITNAVFDVYVYNTSTDWPKDYAEFGVPADWFVLAHYPQGPGNAAVDAALKETGKAYFMAKLPVDLKKWTGRRQNRDKIHAQLEIYFGSRVIY